MRNVSVIIPAYNESRRIGDVLKRVPEEFRDSVIVVDDGSTDRTADVAEKKGFKVIRLKKNSGKMHACTEGIKRGKELCILMDGDGQLNPEEIPRFVRAIGNSDIVLGQRNPLCIPLHRRFTNWCSKKAVRLITGTEIDDVLCGFRCVRKKSFEKMNFSKKGYFFEVEMVLEALEHRMRIATVPVSVSYKTGSRMPVKTSLEIAAWLFGKSIEHISRRIFAKTNL